MTRPAWAAPFDLAGSAAHRRAYVLRRVREGAPVSVAAAEIPIAFRTVSNWRYQVPGFAGELDAARRAGRHTAALKSRLLELMVSGMASTAACKRLGVLDNSPARWARFDPVFAADYARLVGPCKSVRATRRLGRLVDCLARGMSFADALDESGIRRHTVGEWRREGRPQWAMVQRAMAAGAALREGRAG